MKNPFTSPAPKSDAGIFLDAMKVAYERDRDGVIIVTDALYLNDKNLAELPDLADVVVEGSFHAENNQLTTLKGAPRIVYGGFYVQNNRLATLKGAPEEAHSFNCCDNQLASLEHAPRSVATLFWCAGNKLTSLDHAPASTGNTFACERNALQSLAGAPKDCPKIISDFGTFEGWDRVPVPFRFSPAQHQKLADDTVILQRDMPVSKPISLRATPSKMPTKNTPVRAAFEAQAQAPKRHSRKHKQSKPPGPIESWIGKKMFPAGFYS